MRVKNKYYDWVTFLTKRFAYFTSPEHKAHMNYANTMALNTLNVLAPFLNSIKQNWCIIGSTGLVLHGLDTQTTVIDVVTDEEGASKLANLLSVYKQPAGTEEGNPEEAGALSSIDAFEFAPETVLSSVSHYKIGGTTVRVLSNMKIKVNEGWVKLLEFIANKEIFDFNGYRLIIASLADQLKISKLSGREKDLEAAERISHHLAL